MIVKAIDRIVTEALGARANNAARIAWLETHGLSLHDGADDLVISEVYQDITTKGTIRTRGDLVIPGLRTRAKVGGPYGLHFRKTFTPESPPILRGESPTREMERTRRALTLLGPQFATCIEPLFAETFVYRARVIPGETFASVSPFTERAYEEAVRVAATQVKQYRMAAKCQAAYAVVVRMHSLGVSHADLHLENLLWMPTHPLKAIPIDFGSTVFKADLSEGEWTRTCADDLSEILREAALTQVCLNRRVRGLVFETAIAQAEALFPDKIRSLVQDL